VEFWLEIPVMLVVMILVVYSIRMVGLYWGGLLSGYS